MEYRNQISEPRNRFSFLNMKVDEDVEKAVNLRLLQLLPLAPPHAAAYGTVEQIGSSYFANLSIVSFYQEFSAQATSTHLEKAVNHVLAKIEDQIFRWRFGGSRGSPSSFAHLPMIRSLT